MKEGNEMVEKNSINSKSQRIAAARQKQRHIRTKTALLLHAKPRCLLRQRGFATILLYF